MGLEERERTIRTKEIELAEARGFRKAIASLRDDGVFAAWADEHLDVNNPGDWPIDIARITLADFLESCLFSGEEPTER